jgi:hypothetical protein
MHLYIIGSTLLWYLIEKTIKTDFLLISTLHSILVTYLAFQNDYTDLIVIISTGYFLYDLKNSYNYWLFLVHHIYSIIALQLLLKEPYISHNILNKVLLIEASTPFLNLYYYYKNKSTLVLYLIVQLYIRNYYLFIVFSEYIPLIIDKVSYLETFSFLLFYVINVYWTFTTSKALFRLNQKSITTNQKP